MRKLATIVLLASAFAFAQAQGTSSSVAGKWKIHSSIAGNESDSTCTFVQNGNDLSGTCSGPQGDVKLTGKVDGKNVTWSYQMDYNGSPLTMKYEGPLDAGKIAGTVTVDPFGVSGDMTAVLSADAAPAPAPAPAAAAASSAAAGSSSVVGKWKVHTTIAGNETDSTCTFAQTDNNLSGACISDQGTLKITGKVDGNKVSWSFTSEYNGSPLTVSYTGILDSGKITGDANVDPFGVSGDFTATPAS